MHLRADSTIADLPQKFSSAQARNLILTHGWNATAYQILNPGIKHWFSDSAEGLVGFVESRQRPVTRPNVWVAAGEPVCAEEDVGSTVAEFESAAADKRCRVCWFGADSRLQDALDDRGGYTAVVLGAQPIWDPKRWADVVAEKSSIRAQLSRAKNKGLRVEKWCEQEAEGHPALQQCLDEWLKTRGLPPLHFLVEPQTLHHLEDRQVFVALDHTGPVGFLILSPVSARNGWLVEQIIQGDTAPNGTGSLLLDAAMKESAHAGSSYITLGLSPLSFRAPKSNPNPVWMRFLLGWLRVHGTRFYNFQGLEAFKAKFVPDRWDPIVAITNEPKPSLGTLHAIADAFSGDLSPERLISIALKDAAADEVRTLKQKLVGFRFPSS